MNDGWDFEAAGHGHGSEAVETWGYGRDRCYFGRCSAEGDYCRIELVAFVRIGAWEVEVCFGRRREEYCRHSVVDLKLQLGEIGALVSVLVDGKVLWFVAAAARTSTEQPPPAQHALGVRPGCSQYCTPSYGCLSICCWRKALLMTLEAVRAGCEAEDLVQLSLARTWGLRRWRRCPGWRKFTLDFWTVIFIPRELLSQIQNPKQR